MRKKKMEGKKTDGKQTYRKSCLKKISLERKPQKLSYFKNMARMREKIQMEG